MLDVLKKIKALDPDGPDVDRMAGELLQVALRSPADYAALGAFVVATLAGFPPDV